MARTTQPCRSEEALLCLKSFYGGEAGKNDKGFPRSAGTEEKDIQEGEDREAMEVLRTVLPYLQERSPERGLSIGKGNDGAPGIDGKSFAGIEAEGKVMFLYPPAIQATWLRLLP
ncbi:MAG: hypothetical protein HUU09_14510 [Candidatus Jettenia caeni]|nr:hypothetical protein [Candidatus Jettenia caeni]WKZ16688.1 MAG: hypothetical protein QY317_05120 [Candidatus Jettenia caeni]GJQ44739.1 MAG: hypothetical protein JETCAE04_04930 [Candidatus Jettenia caeni]